MRTLLVVCLLLAGVIAGRAESESELVTRATTALQARDWPTAEKLFRQLATLAPANWTYLQGRADALAAQAKYTDAMTDYDAAMRLAVAADTETSRWAVGAILTAESFIYLKRKENVSAMAAFRKATAYAQNQGVAWFNLCAAGFNTGDLATARFACDKSIEADPNKADAWFIKGSVMFAESTTGPGGKIVPPKGAVEALKKYLALAPNGAHVKDVQEMLAVLN